jgi:inorganic triphosphatase YgiF
VAIDKGEIRTSKGDAVAPISKIEIELKKGDPRVIFDVAFNCSKPRQSVLRRAVRPSEVICCLEPRA